MSSTSLLVRPLEAGDTDTAIEVFAGLSVTSAYHRYGTGLTLLPPRMAAHLAAVEPGRHHVFVADLGGRPVGLARWIRPRGGRADEVEVALEVGDEWQGRGVGRALLAEVARDARAAGIRTLTAYVAPGNVRMVDWLRRLGARPPRDLDDVHRLAVELVTGGSGLAVVA
jgi:acetyltransferase